MKPVVFALFAATALVCGAGTAFAQTIIAPVYPQPGIPTYTQPVIPVAGATLVPTPAVVAGPTVVVSPGVLPPYRYRYPYPYYGRPYWNRRFYAW